MTPFVLPAADGVALQAYEWIPAGPPRAAVQIVHGLAEHAGRYDSLAATLKRSGFAVYAGDLRGHGRTAPTRAEFGFFAAAGGWAKCLNDVGRLNRRIAAAHPGLPIVLLGHSMGSFLVQDFIGSRGEGLAGAVLCGSDGPPSLSVSAGRWIARVEKLRLGPRGRSPLIHALAFGAFSRSVRPARTPFDWLSRDADEVDKYAADPFCGFVATVQLWIDLLDALGRIARPSHLARIPKSLPVYIIAGTCDPVSARTRGLERLLVAYRRAGLTRVTHRFYSGARHELFHETNRDEVTRELIAWLDRLPAGAHS